MNKKKLNNGYKISDIKKKFQKKMFIVAVLLTRRY